MPAMERSVQLDYGREGVEVVLPQGADLFLPEHPAGFSDEEFEVRRALREPIGAKPLAELVSAGDRVAIVIPDGTRALPCDRLVPWLLDELSHVPRSRIVVVNGTGSHRPNTRAEMRRMLGGGVVDTVRVVNHDAFDPSRNAYAGRDLDGGEVFLCREYVEADRRIVLGFIEPHFVAGFSGGYKGVFPGVADIGAIKRYHRADIIGDPASTWARVEGNPTQERVRHAGSLVPVDFLMNVTLNRKREITGCFFGEVDAAWRAGCGYVRCTATAEADRRYDLVVTSNSGFPLDQNLYQSVKGMSAAAQIVRRGGTILCCAECGDGFPDHGNFRGRLTGLPSPRAILDWIDRLEEPVADQWQLQILAMILEKAQVALYSTIPSDQVLSAHMTPVADADAFIRGYLEGNPGASMAVLPEGPQTIPMLRV